MMQWVPWGQTLDDFKAHVRTFRSVFPDVIIASGPGGNGFYMLGSMLPIRYDRTVIRSVLSRRGVLEEISSAYDLSLIHISEPTRLLSISYAVFCLKKK